ncbi:phage tail assembly protein [Bartonella bovis]|uniref:Putative phage related protein n=1 Tax=Bartonella bovis 91-4 TaxID=1094491 RepID=N6UF62_9HYPH|nr:phage tail assembly protein [Bartonella bovis]ENN91154.1 putative phage related protein [Bartonella bovis 91-4]ENN92687.1 putative phage related protein [Bartonella bovis 91-4]
MTTQQNVTYQLLFPFTLKEEDYTEISLRRVKMKDIRAVDKKESADQVAAMITRLSGWTYDAVDELDGSDMAAIGKILEGFTERLNT